MRGVSCSARAEFLEPVLRCFHENLQRYAEAMEWGDLPHYYNERSTLSLFAAACWQSGLIGLEEYVSSKGRGKTAFRGRPDMWAYCPETETEIIIEAKQRWPSLGFKPSKVAGWLWKTEVAALHNCGEVLSAGLTFLVPSLDPTVHRGQVVELFEGLHDEALQFGVDALAWWLPDKAMDHRDFNRKTGKLGMWPGVLTVLRLAGTDISLEHERLRESRWPSGSAPA